MLSCWEVWEKKETLKISNGDLNARTIGDENHNLKKLSEDIIGSDLVMAKGLALVFTLYIFSFVFSLGRRMASFAWAVLHGKSWWEESFHFILPLDLVLRIFIKQQFSRKVKLFLACWSPFVLMHFFFYVVFSSFQIILLSGSIVFFFF